MDLTELQKMVAKFRDERDWEQFHNPKNLAAAIAIESAELQECFLWTSEEKSFDLAKTEAVFDEIADILNYVLLFAETAKIDLGQVFLEKLKKNEQKYPTAKARGRSNKYSSL